MLLLKWHHVGSTGPESTSKNGLKPSAVVSGIVAVAGESEKRDTASQGGYSRCLLIAATSTNLSHISARKSLAPAARSGQVVRQVISQVVQSAR